MKNFWLDRKGPAKTRVNIWLSASVAADAFGIEEGATEKLIDFSDIETALIQSSAVTNKFVPEGTNEMLCLLRVGKATLPSGKSVLAQNFGKNFSCSQVKNTWETLNLTRLT